MEQKRNILAIIEGIVGDRDTAEQVLAALQDQGLITFSYGNQDVNAIIKTFAELFGSTKTTKYDRFAASRMAKSPHYGGSAGVVGMLRLYHSLSGDKYAPSVSSVAQLEEKLPAIVAFLRKKNQASGSIEL